MLFNSYIFLIFLIIVVPTYYFLPKRGRTCFLLMSSYFFYGYWDWRFLSLIAFSTVVDYSVGLKIDRSNSSTMKQRYLLTSILSNLVILGFFKYFGFFADSFNKLCQLFHFHLDVFHLNVILPIGISFYTFKSLSYTIDVYWEKVKPTRSLADYALFVSFFPQLVAGPIERTAHLLPQVEKMPTPTKENFRDGFALLTMGMFKKVIIGDTCGRIVDQIFADPSLYTSLELLMGLILFSMQVYADFSGYSLIAKGTAKFLGIDIMDNFCQPYLSSNITEFWRRWHISLSSWLRDYVFLPLEYKCAHYRFFQVQSTIHVTRFFHINLSLKFKNQIRTSLNLLSTFLLCGLWHGATWTYVFWGGLHGLYMAIHRFMPKKIKTASKSMYSNFFKLCCTQVLVLLAWLFFRAHTFSSAFYILKKFYFWQPSEFSGRIIVIVLTYAGITLVLDVLEYYSQNATFILKLEKPYVTGLYAGLWYVILLYLYQAVPMPFIYFQF
jgi:alginate O-acetyltransferase complex protein AlgI